ncbi:APC family permease [Cryobacterium tepidiphilum]|uniref:APC family permease n=1 Tax=Cryobacterium tepidiphilum TaxID=2486026 RepID=A0A3M8LRB1_9MICO|nr:APC family permease [Cryobacterium tepidiphilum]RNE67442.1 APC family permease [Cryobacterium tepidiphilum]
MDTTHPGTLRRRLKLRHVVFIGLAYMSPFAVFDTFGIVTEMTNGHVPASYIIVTIAIIFTAFSYAKMVRVYPSAGSAYTYTRKTIHPGLGFLVGWAALLDYLFLPMINALLADIYLSAEFPAVPGWVWIVGLIAIVTILNIVGVKISALANMVMVVFQAVIAVVFVALTIGAILADNALQFSLAPFYAVDMDTASLIGGASVLALAFLGFDAVTTLSEETIEPRKTMPRAIMWVAALGAMFFVVVTYCMQTLVPDLAALEQITSETESASPYIALVIGGIVFQTVFLSGAFISVLSSGLASQTSASRLLYAMGRDGILFTRFFGYISPKFGTPVLNIIAVGVVALSALMLDLGAATSLINFGAFTAFAFVNLSVIAFRIRRRGVQLEGSALGWIVAPALGFLINAYLWANLDPLAMTVGLTWTVIGVVYLLWLTRGFRRPVPEMAFDEADEVPARERAAEPV